MYYYILSHIVEIISWYHLVNTIKVKRLSEVSHSMDHWRNLRCGAPEAKEAHWAGWPAPSLKKQPWVVAACWCMLHPIIPETHIRGIFHRFWAENQPMSVRSSPHFGWVTFHGGTAIAGACEGPQWPCPSRGAVVAGAEPSGHASLITPWPRNYWCFTIGLPTLYCTYVLYYIYTHIYIYIYIILILLLCIYLIVSIYIYMSVCVCAYMWFYYM